MWKFCEENNHNEVWKWNLIAQFLVQACDTFRNFFNPLNTGGNYTYHLLEQSIILRFAQSVYIGFILFPE
jgi:hypothetical protein